MLKPLANRTPLHTRRVTYQGFAREDGLWDIEGELHDSKHYSFDGSEGNRPAGAPVHHMFLRVTLDDDFRIHAIETAMDSTPFGECRTADATLQRLVGAVMGAGWRQTIERSVGGVQGCTHLRELLFNLATAAFQTIPHAREMRARAAGRTLLNENSEPPFYMGRCMTWDFNGPVVARVAPQFVGWLKKPSNT
jgi:hypothetical protein